MPSETFHTSRECIDLMLRYGAHNYAPLEIAIVRGEGVWAYDIEGKRYLDMLSAYSALNFGHGNPRIVAAAQRQLATVTLTSRAFHNDQVALACRDLALLCKKQKVLFMNSGAEAVESAVKLARKWGYEKKGVAANAAEIICFSGNFHGRTTTIVSFSDSTTTREGFGPYTPGFVLCRFGEIDEVRKAITKNTVGVLVEPIQGEGGVIIPPVGFLRDLRALCTEQNVLLMADEIQTGFCRTGALFCCDHEQVVPDIYILAKSLGGGVTPISAIVADDPVMEAFTPGSHGSTLGGNPFACAIAREVMAIIREEDPARNAREVGEYFVQQLRAIKSKKITAIRGRGLMIGVDIDPQVGKAKKFCIKLTEHGILCKDTRDQTIRFAPPLKIARTEIDWAMPHIAAVLAD